MVPMPVWQEHIRVLLEQQEEQTDEAMWDIIIKGS